jgi:hypothetical protein
MKIKDNWEWYEEKKRHEDEERQRGQKDEHTWSESELERDTDRSFEDSAVKKGIIQRKMKIRKTRKMRMVMWSWI